MPVIKRVIPEVNVVVRQVAVEGPITVRTSIDDGKITTQYQDQCYRGLAAGMRADQPIWLTVIE